MLTNPNAVAGITQGDTQDDAQGHELPLTQELAEQLASTNETLDDSLARNANFGLKLNSMNNGQFTQSSEEDEDDNEQDDYEEEDDASGDTFDNSLTLELKDRTIDMLREVFPSQQVFHVHEAMVGCFNALFYKPWKAFKRTKTQRERQLELFKEWSKESQTKSATDALGLLRNESPPSRPQLRDTIIETTNRRYEGLSERLSNQEQRIGNITKTLKKKSARAAAASAASAAKTADSEASSSASESSSEDDNSNGANVNVVNDSDMEESDDDENMEAAAAEEEEEEEESAVQKKQRLATVPCTFFLRNKCRRGDNCRFSHDVDVDASRPIPKALRGRRPPKQPATLNNQNNLDEPESSDTGNDNGKQRSKRQRSKSKQRSKKKKRGNSKPNE